MVLAIVQGPHHHIGRNGTVAVGMFAQESPAPRRLHNGLFQGFIFGVGEISLIFSVIVCADLFIICRVFGERLKVHGNRLVFHTHRSVFRKIGNAREAVLPAKPLIWPLISSKHGVK